jgi:hypothetical protein
MTGFSYVTTTTTAARPIGISLYICHDGEDYMAKDTVGLRYGHGPTLRRAVEMWAEEVEWLCTEPSDRLADPILSEQRRYRQALERGAAE